MAEFISPRIVTDGLVLCLDAANRQSYPGSGNAWNDLSGYNNNGTLVNNPTLSNDTFYFTGNNYVTFPVNIYTNDSAIFSLGLWFKISSKGVVLHQTTANNNGTNGGWVPAIYVDSNNKLRVTCFWGIGVSGGYVSTDNIVYDKWYNLVHTFDGSYNRRVYIDGVLVSTINGIQGSYTTTYYLILGSGNAANWPNDPGSGMTGFLNLFSFYKKVLTDGEVLQNYNAMKGRFGL